MLTALKAKLAQYFYGSVTSLYLLWRWLRTGGAALRIKDREMPRRLLADYNHKHLLLPSGVNMHYVEAGDPSFPLMVMVHGFPEFWYSWRFQIAHFEDRYRVVAIDMRGYGETSKPPNITDYSTVLLAKDIDDLIHELGYDDAVVLGHDWGGIATWVHALHYPQSVKRLIICNIPHPAAFVHLLKNDPRQKASSWYMLFFQNACVPEAAIRADDFSMLEAMFSKLKKKGNITSEDMEAWKYTFSQPDTLKSALNYYRCLIQYPERAAKVDIKCTVKTLILWGDKDTALIKEGATLSTEWCEDATLHFIPGASHWVQQDEPEIVNKHIDVFLTLNDSRL